MRAKRQMKKPIDEPWFFVEVALIVFVIIGAIALRFLRIPLLSLLERVLR
jgi:hypothetical protein